MNTQELQNDKLNIIHWISELQDYSVIEKIKAIMSKNKDVSLTLEQKNAIDQALVSIEENGAKTHDAVMEQTRKKFPNLFQK
ncbi:hypothetical protein ACYSNX_11860 [Myroides sp. LJL115]